MTSQQRRFSKHHRRPRAETARPTLKTLPLAVALCFCAPLWADTINPGTVSGLPTGGTVAAGTVSSQLTSSQLTLTQSTQRAVLDWQSFNIDAGKTVQFIQPNANAAVLNRVAASANMSEIYGSILAPGTVVLQNPNGVYFHQGANINVGSLIVTTGRIDQSMFMAEGPIPIDDAISGSITNEGTITAADAGLVALVAPSVSNQGVIVANRGSVLLGGVSTATVSLNGGLYEFAAGSTAAAPAAKVSNSGTIRADGGRVILTASSASAIVNNVINMDGIIQARTLGGREGVVVLEAGGAGGVQVSGQVDATGGAGEAGGKISVTGNAVELRGTARLDASGDTGGGSVFVGGNWQGQGPLRNAQMTTVASGATLQADALGNGDGGTVVVWADGTTRFNGSISARGGATGGDGGAVEVSGKQALGFAGTVDTTAAQGNTGFLLLDPVYAVISSNSSGTAGDTETVNADSLVSALNTTNVTVQADSKVTVDAAVDTRGNANARNLTLNAPTVDLNAAITLKTGATLAGTASTVNVNGSNARIQNGVDVAAVGGRVNVAAGTYAGFRVSKAGVSVIGALGAADQVGPGANAPIINSCTAWGGGVCSSVLIDAENVTVSGFDISNANGPYGVQIGLSSNGAARPNRATLSYNRIHGVYGVNSGDGIRAVAIEPADNVTIKYNLIEDIRPTNAAAGSWGKTVAGIFARVRGGATSNLAIEDNIVRDISITGATSSQYNGNGETVYNGAKGIWIGSSEGTTTASGVTIARNQISGVHSNLIAEGILVNHGRMYGAPSGGTTTGLVVSRNNISDVAGGVSSHGIELSGPTPNAQVSQNDVSLTTSVAADTADVYIDSNSNANSAATTVTVSGNRLTGTGKGVAVNGGATVNASGNWWGTASESSILARTVGAVDFSPFLMSGTDTDLSTAGFQGSMSNLAVTALGSQTGSKSRIEEGVDLVSTGGTVNVGAGTFVQTSMLEIKKAMTLSGAGQASTIIDARSVTAGSGSYGMNVTANDVTLQDFTFYGPSAYYASAYGIKVSPGNVANFPLRNFTIRNVTSRGAGKAELDLNGVDGALIDNVTLNGARVSDGEETQGAGIQLTDSANVTVRNVTTLNNIWGGLALYQANKSYNQQVNNITIEGNNHFNELNPVYMQDESASRDFGNLNIAGFDYAVRNAGSTDSSQYTWLQRTKQNAYDYAVNLPTAGSSYIQDWNGSVATQNFEVGVGTLSGGGTQAMTIATAIDQANSSGATINVGAGTYAQQFSLNKANLTLKGETGAKLEVPDLSVVNGVDAITIKANNVTVEGMEIAGPINAPYYDYYATSKPNVSRGIFVQSGATGFTLRNNNIHDVRTGILINGVGNTGSVQNNRIENTKSGISVQYTDASGVTIANNREGAVGNEWGLNLHLNGHLDDSGNIRNNSAPIASAPTVEWQQSLLSLSTNNNGWTVQDQGYLSQNRTHVTVAKTPSGANNQGSVLTPINTVQGGVNAVVQGGKVDVKSDTYAESVMVDRLMNLSFNDVTLQSLSLTSGAAGSGIGGKLTATGAGGLVFDGGIKLLADTTLATEGRDIALRGAVQNNATIAYGLTLATNAGNGNNRGDVTLRSGGADGNALGQLNVTARNFTLDNTLWVRGYAIDARGDVALSNSTLKATAAGVTSSLTASGNVTGSTTSAGAVVLNSDGNVAANVAAGGAATVSGRNVSGTISGSSVTATAQQVLDAAVTAGATATLTGREVRGSANAATLIARADTTMNLALNVTAADLYAGTRADLSGRAGRVVVESKNSYFSGSFPAVEGKGTGVPFINGVPQRDEQKVPPAAVIVRPPVIVLPPLPPLAPPPPPAPVTSYASADLPSLPPTAAGAPGGTGGGTSPAATGGTGSSGGSGNGAGTGSSSTGGGNGTTGNGSTSSSGGASEGSGSSSTGSTSSGGGGSSSGGATGGGGSGRVAVAAASGPRQVTVTRNAPGKAAGDSLDRGQGVEVDLSPGR